MFALRARIYRNTEYFKGGPHNLPNTDFLPPPLEKSWCCVLELLLNRLPWKRLQNPVSVPERNRFHSISTWSKKQFKKKQLLNLSWHLATFYSSGNNIICLHTHWPYCSNKSVWNFHPKVENVTRILILVTFFWNKLVSLFTWRRRKNHYHSFQVAQCTLHIDLVHRW